MALRLLVLHMHRSFLVYSWSEVYCLSMREVGDVNWEFVINCEVYWVRYVLSLPDCQTVQSGLKLKETPGVSELIILGFDIKLLELDRWYKVVVER
jgi:hypothetical protein